MSQNEKAPEHGFDLESFKADLFDLVDKYIDSIGENFRLPQGESADTETPRQNIIRFFSDAEIPDQQMNAVFQAVAEIIFGRRHQDERLQHTSLEQRAALLQAMTEARLKRTNPEITPEDYRHRISQMLADLG